MTAGATVTCEGLVAVFPLQDHEVVALRGVDLVVGAGETVALLGPSGAGKSTLLSILGGLERPTAGVARVDDLNLAQLGPKRLLALRARHVGVVLQNPGRNLLGYANARDNLLFAQAASRRSRRDKLQRGAALLEAVGVPASGNRPVRTLSGGEQQRLAVAVALANGPRLVLADEPTSQLDAESADAVVALLQSAANDLGTTVIAVTHDPEVGAALDRTVTIRDGRVGAEGRSGEEFVVVGRHGAVQVPEDLFDLLPPGSLARAERTADGLLLRPVAREDL